MKMVKRGCALLKIFTSVHARSRLTGGSFSTSNSWKKKERKVPALRNKSHCEWFVQCKTELECYSLTQFTCNGLICRCLFTICTAEMEPLFLWSISEIQKGSLPHYHADTEPYCQVEKVSYLHSRDWTFVFAGLTEMQKGSILHCHLISRIA